MASQEDIELELEAAQAVYGPDCRVLQRMPPHLQVSLKPRTADDISQQFVEAILVIKANLQYPAEPPELELRDTKGLDEGRHTHMLTELRAQASELTHSPMLVAICEAAIEQLTVMNQPEGNCCFCLFPLVMGDTRANFRPFMKLLSCFHCFHSDCFWRWWRWLLEQQNKESSHVHLISGDEMHAGETAVSTVSQKTIVEESFKELQVNCPVCRKVVHAEDVVHALNFLQDGLVSVQVEEPDTSEVPECLHTDEEIARKNFFSIHFQAQQARGAIIEPKKLEVLVPGMFLAPTASSSTVTDKINQEGQERMQDSQTDRGPTCIPTIEPTDAGEQVLPARNDNLVMDQPTTQGQEKSKALSQSRVEENFGRIRGEYSGPFRKEDRQSRQGRHSNGKQKWIRCQKKASDL